MHYVSYGTPGGEYSSQCRAAIITAVHEVTQGSPIVGLTVMNPGGMFFSELVSYDETKKSCGTWHWPEKTE